MRIFFEGKKLYILHDIQRSFQGNRISNPPRFLYKNRSKLQNFDENPTKAK